jgi:hypothetical protein
MLNERPRTLHVGTESDGFRLTHTPGGRELTFECWGYWDPETCRAFVRHAAAALEKATPPIVLVLSASVLKPQSQEGQDAIRGVLRRVAAVPQVRVNVFATNVLTRMQLTRLAREAQLEFGFVDQPTSTPPMDDP